MRRKIKPAEEEFGNIIYTILFSVVWYSVVLASIVSGGFSPFMMIFLVGGLILPYTAVSNMRRALFYRRQRAEAIALGHMTPGRITGIARQDVPYTTGEHHTLRYRRYYFLKVEICDPVTGVSNTIQSQGYRKPIHRYLASDRVNVYTDQSGWKYYIEDFQWKEHRNDPDIFRMPKEFDELHPGGEVFGKVIFVLVLIWMLIGLFTG